MSQAPQPLGPDRPDGPDTAITLREITKDTVRAICALNVAPHQQAYVAPNATSIAEAHFEEHAWFRAIYADETPVGFVMLFADPETPEYFLWRLMIAAEHQGKGYGRAALRLLIAHVRTLPRATELLVSYHEGAASPRDFYLALGFEDTGRYVDDEVILRLPLS